jgi:succinoglycan biosynthesis transport protein ExoP
MLFRRKSKAGSPPAPVVPAVVPAVMAPAAASGEPDMRGLGRVLWAKKTKVLGITLLAAATAFAVVNTITPRYRSESRLLLEVRDNVFLRAEADKNGGDRNNIDPEAVTSQIQLVLSRDLAREVIKKENLASQPEFDPAVAGMSLSKSLLGLFGVGRDPSSLTPEERTLESYYERLNVYAVEKSRVIAVDFDSANPDLAAKVANTIAETYLKMQQSSKQDQTRAAGTWLAGEIADLRTKVADAEAKVDAYRTKSNLFSGSNNTSLPSQQLTEINSQIAAARGQKADLEARARQLREVIRSGKPIESSDIANSDSMRRLIEQRNALRSTLAEQSTTLLDQHPRIKELKAQIAEVEREMHTEGERLTQQLENDAKVAGDRLETLTASLDTVKKLASQSNEQDVQLRALERDSKTERDLLESYLAKYREATARDNINAAPPEARIISRASPAIKPDYPKKLPTVLIAAFAAFALSAGFTVTGALLSSPPSSYGYGYAPAPYAAPAYVQATMAPPVMPRVASPPLMPAAMPPPPMASAAMMSAPMGISTVEQIAQSLRQAGDAGRRVTVVGAARNAGATYAAIALSRVLAKDSNIVLVDLAFGAPNLSIISIDPKAPGIAELVRGTASFGDIITRDQYSTVHLISTGHVGSDSAMLSASPMLVTVVEALVRSYDHVVIDIGSAADIEVERFAPLASRAVLVAADPTNPTTQFARERLMLAGFADVSLMAGAPQAVAA